MNTCVHGLTLMYVFVCCTCAFVHICTFLKRDFISGDQWCILIVIAGNCLHVFHIFDLIMFKSYLRLFELSWIKLLLVLICSMTLFELICMYVENVFIKHKGLFHRHEPEKKLAYLCVKITWIILSRMISLNMDFYIVQMQSWQVTRKNCCMYIVSDGKVPTF